ncbi:hypothetical protein SAMN05192562_102551 [Kosakonia arachidis]|uniref:Uncharacterized protein n=1 Tax=Kosakonia arachidis TaxID=551989 RepID=A0A1I7BFM1_9ENTR|nr:hypothetical protein SAMN05192562_102551 [Kosakonia arachidis]
MPMSIQGIREHDDQFGLHDMTMVPTAEYRQTLTDGPYFVLIIMSLFVVLYPEKYLQLTENN